MTAKEIELLTAAIEKSFMEKYNITITCAKKPTGKYLLNDVIKKWFLDDNGSYWGKIGDVIGDCGVSCAPAKAWEAIRKLTVIACGKSSVFDLTEDDDADIVADELTEYFYRIAIERKNKNQGEDNEIQRR